MKLRCMICGVVLLASVVCGVAQNPAKAPTPLEQTLLTSEKNLIEAKKKDDAAFFKRTLSADFSLVGVDGVLLQQQEAAGNLGDSDLVELTPYDMKVVTVGRCGHRHLRRHRAPEAGRRSGPSAALSAFQLRMGQAGRRVEAEISSGDRSALGRLVGPGQRPSISRRTLPLLILKRLTFRHGR